jgi:hypothetical protein
MTWARARALPQHSVAEFCREFGLTRLTFERRRRRALVRIVTALNSAGVCRAYVCGEPQDFMHDPVSGPRQTNLRFDDPELSTRKAAVTHQLERKGWSTLMPDEPRIRP